MTPRFGKARRLTIWESLRLLRPELKRSRGTLLVIALLGLGSGLMETASIGMVLVLLSAVFASDAEVDVIGESPLAGLGGVLPEFLSQPGWAAIVLLLFVVSRLGLKSLHSLVTASFALRIAHETRDRLFRALINQSFERGQERSWGESYSLIDEHSHAVPESLDSISNIIQSFVALMALGAMLIWLTPALAAIGIAAALLLSRLMQRLRRVAEAAGQDSVAASQAMSEELIRTFQALRTFHILGLRNRQARRFYVASGRETKAQMTVERISLVAAPASHFVALCAVTAMAVSTDLLGLSYSSLILAVGLLYRSEPYAAYLEESMLLLMERQPQLRLIVGMEAAVTERQGRLLEGRSGAIRIEGLTFRYGSRERPVIDQLDMIIPAEGWTFLDGQSGAGKSTLVNLLLRLVEPDKGRIFIDDIPLDEIDPESWRRRIAVCGQDIELISGSVRDNILLGGRRVSDAAIEEAIAVSGLESVIATLPAGLDTKLGERGAQLSGGQRQRLAIARAIMRDPDLLILDEATSMLDRQSQEAVLSALEKAMAGRKVMVIGHNLSDLPPLAAHYVLSNGRAGPDILRSPPLAADPPKGVRCG